jgi:hypothetical protein
VQKLSGGYPTASLVQVAPHPHELSAISSNTFFIEYKQVQCGTAFQGEFAFEKRMGVQPVQEIQQI